MARYLYSPDGKPRYYVDDQTVYAMNGKPEFYISEVWLFSYNGGRPTLMRRGPWRPAKRALVTERRRVGVRSFSEAAANLGGRVAAEHRDGFDEITSGLVNDDHRHHTGFAHAEQARPAGRVLEGRHRYWVKALP